MALTIHSALYMHPETQFPMTDWILHAIRKLGDWARHQQCEFIVESHSLSKWGRFTEWPYSFEFGTFVKFAAMRNFIADKSRGDRFIWFDLDIYPSERAYKWAVSELPINAFWGWRLAKSWAGYPDDCSDYEHRHPFSKLIWCNAKNDETHFSVGSGIFSISREDAEQLWEFVNDQVSIDSPKWWERHRARQQSCSDQLLKRGGVWTQPWMFGLDEHFIEQFVNSGAIEFEEISHDLHNVHSLDPDAMLVHFPGAQKSLYPQY